MTSSDRSPTFMSLPAELRLAIYAHIFDKFALFVDGTEKAGRVVSPHSAGSIATLAVCRVNRTIRAEALPVFRSRPMIAFSDYGPFVGGQPQQRTQALTPRLANRIHICIICFDGSWTFVRSLPRLKAVAICVNIQLDSPGVDALIATDSLGSFRTSVYSFIGTQRWYGQRCAYYLSAVRCSARVWCQFRFTMQLKTASGAAHGSSPPPAPRRLRQATWLRACWRPKNERWFWCEPTECEDDVDGASPLVFYNPPLEGACPDQWLNRILRVWPASDSPRIDEKKPRTRGPKLMT